MALVACKECGAEVSTQARACPKCGAIRTPISIGRILVGLVVACALLYWLGSQYFDIQTTLEGEVISVPRP